MIVVSRGNLWRNVLPAMVIAVVACHAVGIRLAFDFSVLRLGITAFTIAMIVLRDRYPRPTIRRGIDALELLLLFATIAATGALFSCVMAATSTGYVDAELAAADRLLGFDWPAMYRFIATHPSLQLTEFRAYCTIFSCPPLLLLYCAWTDRADHARSFLVTFAIALFITVVLFHWFPARGAEAYYGTPLGYQPGVGPRQVEVMRSLRSGGTTVIDLANLPGIISFPSFHAVCAVLFVRAAWPLRPLRWVVLPMNAAMVLATPVEGSHYGVDVLGGFVVAGLAIAIGRTLPWQLPLRWPHAVAGAFPSRRRAGVSPIR